MSNEGISRLHQLIQLYSSAVADLERLREQAGGNQELLAVFEPSALYAVDAVRQEIQDTLELVHPGTDEADVWIRLKGPALAGGRVPVSLLGKYLRGLSVANRHAVSIIKRVAHTGRRFVKEVADVAEFSLVRTAPGSIRIGLVRPDASGFAPAWPEDGQAVLFPGLMIEAWCQAERESKTAVEGLRLLVRAVEASENNGRLRQLCEDVGQRDAVTLLHHARTLAPSSRGPIDSVDLYGVGIERTAENPVRLTADTGEILRLCVESLLDEQKTVQAHGRIRAIDIDYRRFVARPLYFDDSDAVYMDLECRLPDDMDESYIETILNRPVSISGVTVLSETGEIKAIDVLDVECDRTAD